MIRRKSRSITIFTPSDASGSNTNAQSLTVKEIVARLPEDVFRVVMICDGTPDPRIQARKNTELISWTRRGNTIRLLRHCLFPPPHIYFFPRTGPLDRIFFDLRKHLGLRTALVTYIVMSMNATTSGGMIGRSVLEADMVFGNSAHVAETIHEVFSVEARPIYDGIDRRYYFPDKQVQSGNPVVLYAGSLQARKRVDRVIQEAARLPRLQFRLAGKGETEEPCRDLARRLGCRNVSFLGHLSSENLGAEMRKADIFLFPSILEGNPQVLLQASACGLPCVAMDLYHSDYVINGETGFLARTDAELSQCLDRLINSAALRRSFAEAAIRHASHFEWEDIAGQWAEVFEKAVAKRQF